MFWDTIKQTFKIKTIWRLYYLALLFIYFCYKIIESGALVGIQILKGSKGEDGGMVDYKTKLTKPWQLIILFNMLSMTPGSLSVDLLDDGQIIKVHLLRFTDKDEFLKVTAKIEKLIEKTF